MVRQIQLRGQVNQARNPMRRSHLDQLRRGRHRCGFRWSSLCHGSSSSEVPAFYTYDAAPFDAEPRPQWHSRVPHPSFSKGAGFLPCANLCGASLVLVCALVLRQWEGDAVADEDVKEADIDMARDEVLGADPKRKEEHWYDNDSDN